MSCNEESCKQPDFDELDVRCMQYAEHLVSSAQSDHHAALATTENLTYEYEGRADAQGVMRRLPGAEMSTLWGENTCLGGKGSWGGSH